jgi:hypothetical protein
VDAANDQPGPKVKADDASIAAKTPEQALRTFMIAMMTKDEPTLSAVTLPTEDFAWLLGGKALPANQVERFKAQLDGQEIRVLQPGDEIALPGNRTITVQAEEVAADRALLLPPGAPVPTRLRKVDGLWRVDAATIIEARKAADSAQEKVKNGTS